MKKTIATSVTGILILLFLISIGATVSAFKVAKEKVEVKNIGVICDDEVIVKNKDGQIVEDLKIKSSAVGVRPATGKEDVSTHIPSTVNDTIGTEGAYAEFYLTTNKPFKIVLASCSLSAGMEENLGNVKIAVLDDDASAVDGNDINGIILSGEPCNNKKYIVCIWLASETTKSISGADIFLSLSIENNV